MGVTNLSVTLSPLCRWLVYLSLLLLLHLRRPMWRDLLRALEFLFPLKSKIMDWRRLVIFLCTSAMNYIFNSNANFLASQVHCFPLWCFQIVLPLTCISILPSLEEAETINLQELQRMRSPNYFNVYEHVILCLLSSHLGPFQRAIIPRPYIIGLNWVGFDSKTELNWSLFYSTGLDKFRDELKQIVCSDLEQLLGTKGEPTSLKYGIFYITLLTWFALNLWQFTETKNHAIYLVTVISIGARHSLFMGAIISQFLEQ